ncbi:MAG: response regulator [Gemmatimonadetes bacterium]|nr:response regulator [Gemmatimonadota bacterium]
MSAPRPARILIADDDRAFRVSTTALLRQDGYHVTEVRDGQAAIDASRGGGFDLLLLDLRMPRRDGLGVVEQLRSEGEGLPILMLSGFGTPEVALRALQLGADDFLIKPFEPDVLAAHVHEILQRRECLRRRDNDLAPEIRGGAS